MAEKKVYIPTTDELYTMQEMGANIYKYLLIKTIETIVMDGFKYPAKGMLKNVYKTLLRDNPDIEYVICKMYPNELKYSQFASSETFIFEYLINKEDDKSIYNLDNLVYANKFAINDYIRNRVIEILESKLKIMPQYRFEYKDWEFADFNEQGFPILKHNILLNSIFGGNYEENIANRKTMEKLINIEPAYAIKYKDILDTDSVGLLRQGVNQYGLRYGIGYDVGTEYRDKDILTNPDDKVKRLVRCINNGEKKIRL